MAKSSKPKKKTAAKKKPDPFKNKGKHPLKDKGIDPAVLNARLGLEAVTGVKFKSADEFNKEVDLSIPPGYTLRDRFIAHYHRDGFHMMKGESGRYWHLKTLELAQEGIHLNANGTFTVDPEPEEAKSGYSPLTLSDVKPGFSHMQRLFILHYVTNRGNQTQAALKAGYSPASAYQTGYENMKNPEIKAEIDRLISERLMPKDEVLQRLSQMARANLNDYLTTVKKVTRPMIKVGLNAVIARIREQMEDQEEFIKRANITDVDRLKGFRRQYESWHEEIIKLEIELRRNPAAYQETEGPEVIEEVVELDVVKLMQDKERGLIKSLKRNRNGEIEVELYGADGALRDIGRYHGIFEKDNKRFNINTEPLSVEDAKKINEALERDY